MKLRRLHRAGMSTGQVRTVRGRGSGLSAVCAGLSAGQNSDNRRREIVRSTTFAAAADYPRSRPGLFAGQKSKTGPRELVLIVAGTVVPDCPHPRGGLSVGTDTEQHQNGQKQARLLDCPRSRPGLSVNRESARTERPKNHHALKITRFAGQIKTNYHQIWTR